MSAVTTNQTCSATWTRATARGARRGSRGGPAGRARCATRASCGARASCRPQTRRPPARSSGRLKPQCAVHHDRDEEQREVHERVEVHGARDGAPPGRCRAQETEGVRDEERAEDDRRGEVEEAEPTGDEEE